MGRPSHSSYDAIVVGARVAGATVAALLGDRGVNVLLVERVRFPSTTISTHFFRGAGLVAVLDRLSVLEDVLRLGCPPLRREWSFGFGTPGPDEGPPQDPGDVGYCLSARRAPLDQLLLERARSSGTVEVAQPVTVRGLLYNSGRVVGVRLDDHGHEYEAHSRIVIGADGRHSLVAREVGAPVERAVEPLRTLYYRYVSGWRGPDGASPDAAEFSLNGDEMAYVFPSDGAVACVGLSAHRDAFSAFRSAPQSELDRRLRAHAGLATRLEATVPVGRVAGGPPEANWVRTPTGPGWALIGDAAVHQDPWTGEGMDNAGMAAMFMAEAIADWLGGGVTEDEAFAHYRALRDEHVLASFDECTTVGRDLRQLAAGSASGS